jgi:hypothetical protein
MDVLVSVAKLWRCLNDWLDHASFSRRLCLPGARLLYPPAGLNEYAQMQDYLDCHGSWREHACFVERGYTEVIASPRSARIDPLKPSIAHSRP